MSALAATQPEPIQQSPRPALTRWDRRLKRMMDVLGAGALLILSAPLMAALALRIKLHDGGPALFRRRVIGPNGEFDAFKLRTMRVDADEVLRRDEELRRQFEINFKLKNDPRVTPVGVAFRRNSLDELPQLWNVLKGEMSLVGPRMITPAELKRYGTAGWIFQHMRPGLTGYWQIHGKEETGYDHRINMDLFYVENWSLLFDLKILIRTPWRVLRGSGV
ncbi:MAG: sugar transferase [Acidobacteriia bacterium]|nr:sugar transferase [Terriglobia bacterium]